MHTELLFRKDVGGHQLECHAPGRRGVLGNRWGHAPRPRHARAAFLARHCSRVASQSRTVPTHHTHTRWASGRKRPAALQGASASLTAAPCATDGGLAGALMWPPRAGTAACCSVCMVVYCWYKVRHEISGFEAAPARRRRMLPDFRAGRCLLLRPRAARALSPFGHPEPIW